jgi:methionyl aminopeptidase
MILSLGGEPAFKGYRGYKYATCLSVNAEVVHGIPGERVLKEGDMIGVDVGARVSGFYGDCAATFPVGKISKKAEKIIVTADDCLKLAIKRVRAGAHLGDIGETIEARAKREGFSVVRDLFGHGVGKSLHEDPLIPNYGVAGEGPELLPGMVLAIEPMVNEGGSEILTLPDGWTVVTKDGGLSAHFEHTVLVTKKGAEVLTET